MGLASSCPKQTMHQAARRPAREGSGDPLALPKQAASALQPSHSPLLYSHGCRRRQGLRRRLCSGGARCGYLTSSWTTFGCRWRRHCFRSRICPDSQQRIVCVGVLERGLGTKPARRARSGDRRGAELATHVLAVLAVALQEEPRSREVRRWLRSHSSTISRTSSSDRKLPSGLAQNRGFLAGQPAS
jgi:hypothetical protein